MAAPVRVLYAEDGPVTAADVAALPGPVGTLQPTIYVDEFDATYRWTPGSILAANGFRVLSHTGGSAGRWILDGDAITLTPRGGILDDWARVGLAMAAMAGFGSIHFMNTGPLVPWRVDTNQVTPSYSKLHLNGAYFVSTLVDASPVSFAGSVFFNDGGRPLVATTTLNANAAVGAVSVTVVSAAAIAIGDRILIQRGIAWWTQREVINKVGNVLTLDRPLLQPYVTTNDVRVLPTARNIEIYGAGATVTGTGTAVIELVSARDCIIEDINADVTMRWGFIFDVGSRDSIFRRCSCDSNAVAQSASFVIALSENCGIVQCDSYRPAAANIYLGGVDNCYIEDGFHTGSGASALHLAVDDVTNTLGCRGVTVKGGIYTKAVTAGVLIDIGNSNTFTGVELSYNQSGITFAIAAVNGNVLEGGVLRGNTVLGVGNAGVGNKVIGVNFQAHDVGYIESTAGSELEVIGCSINDDSAVAATVAMIVATGAGTVVRVSGTKMLTGRNAEHGIRVLVGAKVFIDGATRYESTSTNGIGVLVDAGVARISGFVATSPGAGGTGVFLNGATAYARIADDVDCSACATPFFIAAGAFNRSLVPIALTGAVAVALAFGDTTAQDRCFVTTVAAGGTPAGILFTGAPVVGTGFNVNGIALDTSTFHYDIH